jgi:hypothetical protein
MALRALDAGLPFARRPELRAQLKEAVDSTRDRALAAAFEDRYGQSRGG